MRDLNVGDQIWCIGQNFESEMYGNTWPLYPFKARLVGVTGLSAELEVTVSCDDYPEEISSHYCSTTDLFGTAKEAEAEWRKRAMNYADWLFSRAEKWKKAAETGVPIDGITDSF